MNEKYFCQYCGAQNVSIFSLTHRKCDNSPNGMCVVYDGAEKEKYFCQYCGAQDFTIFSLTHKKCQNSPTGKHVPSINQGVPKKNNKSEYSNSSRRSRISNSNGSNTGNTRPNLSIPINFPLIKICVIIGIVLAVINIITTDPDVKGFFENISTPAQKETQKILPKSTETEIPEIQQNIPENEYSDEFTLFMNIAVIIYTILLVFVSIKAWKRYGWVKGLLCIISSLFIIPLPI
jgi:hypothetical protein